ncbi:MAG: hypothetical protein ACEQSA_02580 [Weeksellaceae bacterium]
MTETRPVLTRPDFTGSEEQLSALPNSLQCRLLLRHQQGRSIYDTSRDITPAPEIIENALVPGEIDALCLDIRSISQVESTTYWQNQQLQQAGETTTPVAAELRRRQMTKWGENLIQNASKPDTEGRLNLLKKLLPPTVVESNDAGAIADQLYKTYKYDDSTQELKSPKAFVDQVVASFNNSYDHFSKPGTTWKADVTWLASQLYGKDIAAKLITEIIDAQTELRFMGGIIAKRNFSTAMANPQPLADADKLLLDNAKYVLENNRMPVITSRRQVNAAPTTTNARPTTNPLPRAPLVVPSGVSDDSDVLASIRNDFVTAGDPTQPPSDGTPPIDLSDISELNPTIFETKEFPSTQVELIGEEEKFKIVISPDIVKKANNDMLNRSWSSGNFKEEGGVFIGKKYKTAAGETWTEVVDYLPADSTNSTSGELNFTDDSWGNLNTTVDRLNKQNGTDFLIVGWAHTHPEGWQGMMSGQDDFINQNLFPIDGQFAYVFGAGQDKNAPLSIDKTMTDTHAFFSKDGSGSNYGFYSKQKGIYMQKSTYNSSETPLKVTARRSKASTGQVVESTPLPHARAADATVFDDIFGPRRDEPTHKKDKPPKRVTATSLLPPLPVSGLAVNDEATTTEPDPATQADAAIEPPTPTTDEITIDNLSADIKIDAARKFIDKFTQQFEVDLRANVNKKNLQSHAPEITSLRQSIVNRLRTEATSDEGITDKLLEEILQAAAWNPECLQSLGTQFDKQLPVTLFKRGSGALDPQTTTSHDLVTSFKAALTESFKKKYEDTIKVVSNLLTGDTLIQPYRDRILELDQKLVTIEAEIDANAVPPFNEYNSRSSRVIGAIGEVRNAVDSTQDALKRRGGYISMWIEELPLGIRISPRSEPLPTPIPAEQTRVVDTKQAEKDGRYFADSLTTAIVTAKLPYDSNHGFQNKQSIDSQLHASKETTNYLQTTDNLVSKMQDLVDLRSSDLFASRDALKRHHLLITLSQDPAELKKYSANLTLPPAGHTALSYVMWNQHEGDMVRKGAPFTYSFILPDKQARELTEQAASNPHFDEIIAAMMKNTHGDLYEKSKASIWPHTATAVLRMTADNRLVEVTGYQSENTHVANSLVDIARKEATSPSDVNKTEATTLIQNVKQALDSTNTSLAERTAIVDKLMEVFSTNATSSGNLRDLNNLKDELSTTLIYLTPSALVSTFKTNPELLRRVVQSRVGLLFVRRMINDPLLRTRNADTVPLYNAITSDFVTFDKILHELRLETHVPQGVDTSSMNPDDFDRLLKADELQKTFKQLREYRVIKATETIFANTGLRPEQRNKLYKQLILAAPNELNVIRKISTGKDNVEMDLPLTTEIVYSIAEKPSMLKEIIETKPTITLDKVKYAKGTAKARGTIDRFRLKGEDPMSPELTDRNYRVNFAMFEQMKADKLLPFTNAELLELTHAAVILSKRDPRLYDRLFGSDNLTTTAAIRALTAILILK